MGNLIPQGTASVLPQNGEGSSVQGRGQQDGPGALTLQDEEVRLGQIPAHCEGGGLGSHYGVWGPPPARGLGSLPRGVLGPGLPPTAGCEEVHGEEPG